MTANEWNISDLLHVSGSYWNACTLHAGVKLDIFTVLDGTPRDARAVAERLTCDARAVGMLLDALTALSLLDKSAGSYSTTPFSSDYLSRNSETYMGHIIKHHHHLVAGWARLDEAVKSGGPVRQPVAHEDEGSVRESFLMGMFNLATLLAPRISQAIDLTGCRRLLDLGGGPGTYAIHFCRANPDLGAQIFDLPSTRQFAEATVARFDLSSRIDFVSGDFNADPVPGCFDAVWLSHVVHADGPDSGRKLLTKAVAALNPGGLLMVQEFILNDRKDGPEFPALFALNMLIGTDSGRSYSQSELCCLMSDAGLSDVTRLDLDLPNGAGIMTGRKQLHA